jgi:hypothetical protein
VRMSFIISAFLHLLLLAVLLINYSLSQKPLAAAHQPVAVDILAPSDVSRTKAGDLDKPDSVAAPKTLPTEKKAEISPTDVSPAPPEPKPVEKVSKKQALLPPPPKLKAPQAEPAPKEVEAPTPKPIPVKRKVEKVAAAVPERKPPRDPQPKPEKAPKRAVQNDRNPGDHAPQEKADEEMQEPPQREEQRREETPREEIRRNEQQREPNRDEARHDVPRFSDRDTKEERNKFDANRIAALLNRDPNAGQQLRTPGPPQPWRRPSSLQDQANGLTPNAPEHTSYGMPSGHDDQMSANEIDAFIAQISRCWAPPVGGLGSDAIVVKLHIALNENGMLARPPQVANNGGSPFFMPAADSAIRAVLQCQPYRMPSEKFTQWRDMMLNFDPREMHGG